MRRDLDLDQFPVGRLVKTPSGRVGVVQKSRGNHSKTDHFMRVVIWFGPRQRDSVVLQPGLLQPFFFIQD